MEFVLKFLKIRKYESRKIAVLSGLFFLAFLYLLSVDNILQTKFIWIVGADYLPYVYLSLGLGLIIQSMIISAAFSKFNKGIINNFLLLYMIFVHAIASVILVNFPAETYLIGIIYVITNIDYFVLWSLILNLARDSLDVESNKRLFPILFAAGTAGGVASGVYLKSLSSFVELNSLFLISFAPLIIVAILINNLSKKSSVKKAKVIKKQFSFFSQYRYLISNSFFLNLVFFGVLAVSSFWINDYIFSRRLVLILKDESLIAGSLGLYEVFYNVGLIVFELFIMSRLLLRLGVIKAIYLIVFAIFVGTVFSIFGDSLALLFCSKLFFSIFVFSASNDFFQILYQAINHHNKESISSMLQLVISGAGIALGASIVLANNNMNFAHQSINYFLLLTAFVLFVAWFLIGKKFFIVLKNSVASFNPEEMRKFFGGNVEELNSFLKTNLSENNSIKNLIALEFLSIVGKETRNDLVSDYLMNTSDSFKLKIIDLSTSGDCNRLLLLRLIYDPSDKVISYLVLKIMIHHEKLKLSKVYRGIRSHLPFLDIKKADDELYVIMYSYILTEKDEYYHDTLQILYDRGKDSDAMVLLEIIENHPAKKRINEEILKKVFYQYIINKEILKKIAKMSLFYESEFYIMEFSSFFYNYDIIGSIFTKNFAYSDALLYKNTFMSKIYLLQINLESSWDLKNKHLSLVRDVLTELEKIGLEASKIGNTSQKTKCFLLDEVKILTVSSVTIIINYLFLFYGSDTIDNLYDQLLDETEKKYSYDIIQNTVPAEFSTRIIAILERNFSDIGPALKYEPFRIGLRTEILYNLCKYIGGEFMESAIQKKVEKLFTLKNIPMFHELDINDLIMLSEKSKVAVYPPNEMVLREGEESDNFYIIVSGSVDILKKGVKFAEVGEGGIIGELGVIQNVPRTATVRTINETTFLIFEGDEFSDVLKKNGSIAYSVLRTLSERIVRLLEMR